MIAEPLTFNGINGSTGRYLLSGLKYRDLVDLCQTERTDASHLAELRNWYRWTNRVQFGPQQGFDPRELSEVGWSVLLAHNADPAILEALRPLLDHRRSEATRRSESLYREFVGVQGYRPGESKVRFLARHGASPGPADPERLPYYVLIVGSPEDIPYSFQYQINLEYAVGRLYFEKIEEYESYAKSVVAAETRGSKLRRHAAFFGVGNNDDTPTQLCLDRLFIPLAHKLKSSLREWDVQIICGEDASKNRLASLFHEVQRPDVLVFTGHGMAFDLDDGRQRRHQGALLCADWPGPSRGRDRIEPDSYFSADDVADDASPSGLISFSLASYSAGSPRWDDFGYVPPQDKHGRGASAGVSQLAQRLLGHPRGGSLAFVGHIERTWSYSLPAPTMGLMPAFDSVFHQLLHGDPIGLAMEYVDERYAEAATELRETLEEINFGRIIEDVDLAQLWAAQNDARSFQIVGDPAVRLPYA